MLYIKSDMKHYRNLFIDLDDTIWDFTGNSRIVYRTLYDKFNYDRFFDSFDTYIRIFEKKNEELWTEYGKGNITKDELNERRFAYPLQTVGIENRTMTHQFMTEALDMMPTMSGVVEGAIDILEYLKPKYNLYILSNGFRELQYNKMKSAGIYDYFNKVILSEDIKVHKPNVEIFHFALSATQSEFSNSIMIGDNIETDIRGAKDAGIDQIYFNRWNNTALPVIPTYTISKLKELKNVL